MVQAYVMDASVLCQLFITQEHTQEVESVFTEVPALYKIYAPELCLVECTNVSQTTDASVKWQLRLVLNLDLHGKKKSLKSAIIIFPLNILGDSDYPPVHLLAQRRLMSNH